MDKSATSTTSTASTASTCDSDTSSTTKRTVFINEEANEEIPWDVLVPYQEAYQVHASRYVGEWHYERAARKMQAFVKPHLLPLMIHSDKATDLVEDILVHDEERDLELARIRDDVEYQKEEIRTQFEQDCKTVENIVKKIVKQQKKQAKLTREIKHEEKVAATIRKVGKRQRKNLKKTASFHKYETRVSVEKQELEKVEQDIQQVEQDNAKYLATLQAIAAKIGPALVQELFGTPEIPGLDIQRKVQEASSVQKQQQEEEDEEEEDDERTPSLLPGNLQQQQSSSQASASRLSKREVFADHREMSWMRQPSARKVVEEQRSNTDKAEQPQAQAQATLQPQPPSKATPPAAATGNGTSAPPTKKRPPLRKNTPHPKKQQQQQQRQTVNKEVAATKQPQNKGPTANTTTTATTTTAATAKLSQPIKPRPTLQRAPPPERQMSWARQPSSQNLLSNSSHHRQAGQLQRVGKQRAWPTVDTSTKKMLGRRLSYDDPTTNNKKVVADTKPDVAKSSHNTGSNMTTQRTSTGTSSTTTTSATTKATATKPTTTKPKRTSSMTSAFMARLSAVMYHRNHHHRQPTQQQRQHV